MTRPQECGCGPRSKDTKTSDNRGQTKTSGRVKSLGTPERIAMDSSELAFLITTVFGLGGSIIPPVLASKGRGYRGLWAALIFVAGFAGFFMFLISPSPNSPEFKVFNSAQIKVIAELMGSIGLSLFGVAFGCFLATLMFRKKTGSDATSSAPAPSP